MDDLFKHPLWMMWKYAYPKDEDKVRRDVREAEGKLGGFYEATPKNGETVHVER